MSLAVSIVPKGFKEAEKALKGLDKAFPRAAADAINYGLRAGSTLAAKLITKKYNIKSATIKGKLDVVKANWSRLGGALAVQDSMLPISLFNPKIRRKRIVRRGPRAQFVSAAIIRGKTKLIKGAFQAKGKIFERRGPGRDAPLGIVSTIGIPHMIGSLGISERVEKTIAAKTAERLEHNVKRELSRK